MVKNPWVRKTPWIRKWLLTLVFLTGEIHGQRSLVGCSLCGHQESDMTERLMHFSLSFAYEKGTGGLPTIPPAADGFCCNEISVWKADGDFCLCTVEESSLRCLARPKSFWWAQDRNLWKRFVASPWMWDSLGILVCYTSRHLTFKNSLTFSFLTSSLLVQFSYFRSLLC